MTLVIRYYAYYPADAAIERKCPMYERDTLYMGVDLSDGKKNNPIMKQLMDSAL